MAVSQSIHCTVLSSRPDKHCHVISRWLQASLAAISEAGLRTCWIPWLMGLGDGQTPAAQSGVRCSQAWGLLGTAACIAARKDLLPAVPVQLMGRKALCSLKACVQLF